MNLRLLMLPIIVKAFTVKVGRFTPPTLPVIREPTLPFDKPLYLPSGSIQPSFLREAELKHSRLAMVSVIAFPLLEQLYPDLLGIDVFQHLPDAVQLSFVQLMFISEFTSMIRGWCNPFEAPFTLLEKYQPGDLGFGLWKPSMGDSMDKELNNGRLAMIGMLGMMVQELVTHQRLF
jgi:light-harvesting complex I chlorophyll a/b binding protein 1